ncbi:hypothetical protein PCE1_000908 [Barthelona sp. PCE]
MDIIRIDQTHRNYDRSVSNNVGDIEVIGSFEEVMNIIEIQRENGKEPNAYMHTRKCSIEDIPIMRPDIRPLGDITKDFVEGYTYFKVPRASSYCVGSFGYVFRTINDYLKTQNNQEPIIVCNRGTLTQFVDLIMNDRRDKQSFFLIARKGNILQLKNCKSFDCSGYGKNLGDFIGRRFELYCTKEDGNIGIPQFEAAQHIIYKRRMGRFSFILTAEIDALDTNDEENIQTVEIKTVQERYFRRVRGRILSDRSFRPTAIKWWTQSYLAGITQLVIGVKSPNSDSIEDIISISTDEFAKQCRLDTNEIIGKLLMFMSVLYHKTNGKPGVLELMYQYLDEVKRGEFCINSTVIPFFSNKKVHLPLSIDLPPFD